ncbi:MAG: hypothetical protein RBS99_10340 [Rhodospirillales bacterium]|jgi:hypothetical protein|nr:hypothetical protein [Rhodospirillales bacterium]
MNNRFIRRSMAWLVLAALAVVRVTSAADVAPSGADDEPDQLSWPFFADCQPVVRHFFAWARTNPPPDRIPAPAASPARAYPFTWIKAATLVSDNAQWRAEQVTGTNVLRGPGGHNFWDHANTEVEIARDGYYRLWTRYYHRQGKNETFTLVVTPAPTGDFSKPDMASKFHLFSEMFSKSHFRRGIDPTPTTADQPTGFLWEGSHRMAFLKAGRYRLRFSGGIYERHDDPKISDIVFAADPLVVPADADIPAENISGERPPCDELAANAAWFAIRPGSRDPNAVSPALREYWRAWRRALLDKLAVSEHTDYVWGNLAAMTFFDDESNLVGRPAEIRAQRARDARPATTFVIHGDQFQNLDPEQQGWNHSPFFAKAYPAPRNITGPSKNSDLAAFYDVDIPEAGRYVLWVHYFFIKGWARVAIESGGKSRTEFDVGGRGNWQASGLVDLPAGRTRIVLRRKDDPPGAKPREYESPILVRFVLTRTAEFAPAREVDYPAGDRIGDGPTGCWLAADPWAGFTRFTGAESLYYTPYAPCLRKTLEPDAINPTSAVIVARQGAVVSQLFMLRNNTTEPIVFTPELHAGNLPAAARLVAYMLPSNGRWSPMLLLHRRAITAPPGQNTAVWLSFDCRQVPEGVYPVVFKAHDHAVRFTIKVNGSLAAAPIPYVGVYARPYPRASSWEAFRDAGITMLFHAVLSKAEMKQYGFLHLASVPFEKDSEAGIRRALDETRAMGLAPADWSWYLIDEPGPSRYAAWLEMAERIRGIDPAMQIWCNLGEGAPRKDSLPTLMRMMDYWDVSCPYRTQFGVATNDKDYEPYVAKLRVAGRIRMLYGTLDIGSNEKLLWAPLEILRVAAEAEQNNRNGWAFFSLIYGPPWDDVYTGNQDHAVSLYPGAHGRTLGTRNMEAVRESVQRWRNAKLNPATDN